MEWYIFIQNEDRADMAEAIVYDLVAGRSRGAAAAKHTYGGKLTTIVNTLAEDPARLESIKKELRGLECPILGGMEVFALSPWGLDETLSLVRAAILKLVGRMNLDGSLATSYRLLARVAEDQETLRKTRQPADLMATCWKELPLLEKEAALELMDGETQAGSKLVSNHSRGRASSLGPPRNVIPSNESTTQTMPPRGESMVTAILRTRPWRTASSVGEIADILTELHDAVCVGWKTEKATRHKKDSIGPLSSAVLGSFITDKVKSLLMRDDRDGSVMTLWSARSAATGPASEARLKWYVTRLPGELADTMELLVLDLTAGSGRGYGTLDSATFPS